MRGFNERAESRESIEREERLSITEITTRVLPAVPAKIPTAWVSCSPHATVRSSESTTAMSAILMMFIEPTITMNANITQRSSFDRC